MWSSCGFNMDLFREYLSAVVSSLMDRDWLSFRVLHKKMPDSQALQALLLALQNPDLFSSPHIRLPACLSTGWELRKFLSPVKRLLICKGKPRFFVSCETLDTGKWASPAAARQLSSLQTGEEI